MTVRGLTLAEVSDFNKLATACFNYTTSGEGIAPTEMPPERLREFRGFFNDDDKFLAGMIQLEMNCRFEGHDCGFLGVGGVISDPTERRNGSIRRIFEKDLPTMRERGFVFSALYPFSHIFYRKFGYEIAGIRRDASVRRADLRGDLCRAARIVRLLPDGPVEDAHAVYNKCIEDKNFALIRTDRQWKPVLSGSTWENYKHGYVLYNDANEPISYWVGTIKREDDGAVLDMQDMAYVDENGLEAIFAMIRGMNEVSRIKLLVPADVELRYLVEEAHSIEDKTSCAFMVRVLDVEKALAMLPAPALAGSCTIAVTDAQIPENNGCFTVTGDGERLSVEKTGNAPDLTCTINGLSGLIAGMQDFKGACRAHLAKVENAEKNRFMAELFRQRKQFLHTHF